MFSKWPEKPLYYHIRKDENIGIVEGQLRSTDFILRLRRRFIAPFDQAKTRTLTVF